MQSTSARAAASELMNKVAPTRIAEVASTSAHSLPSQTPFDAYATEASGWMPTEKAASVRPFTHPTIYSMCPTCKRSLFLVIWYFFVRILNCGASETFTLFTDVDECATANGGCDGQCSNRPGSFICSCPIGFRLASNGKKCIGTENLVFFNFYFPSLFSFFLSSAFPVFLSI